MIRFSSILIPNNSCFPLISNTNRSNLIFEYPGFLQGYFYYFFGIFPNFKWIMFYPTCFWEYLLMFDLMRSYYITFMIEQNKPSTCSSLINSSYIFLHFNSLSHKDTKTRRTGLYVFSVLSVSLC